MMRTWIRYLPFIFILLFALLLIPGCDKYSRYKVLNIFFDGVPHPDEPQKKTGTALDKTAKADQSKRADQAPEKPRYKHPASEGKDECSSCHGGVNRTMLPPKDICLKCHSPIIKDLAFVHGPAAVDCIVCHNVHESQVKTLVRKVGNPLCLDCHDKKDVVKAEPHNELKEEELVCLSCHAPHGGKDKFFLK